MADIVFRGDDWTELGVVFGILCEEDDEQTAGHVKKAIGELAALFETHNPQLKPEDFLKLNLCRRFVETIANASDELHYESPIWRGLLQVKDDWTFLRFLIILLEYMWT